MEFQGSQGYTEKPCLKKQKQNKQQNNRRKEEEEEEEEEENDSVWNKTTQQSGQEQWLKSMN